MFYEVLVGRNFGKSDGVLTYNFDGSLLAGQIVLVPVGRVEVPGIVVKKVAQPDFATKPISKILYSTPLPKHLVEVIKFIAEYYLAPMSSVVNLVLPNGIQKKRRKSAKDAADTGEKSENMGNARKDASDTGEKTEHFVVEPKFPLNKAQKQALEGLEKALGATKLLNGVTGSGKTNIYLEEAYRTLRAQKSVILLVPEIALTGQVVRFFQNFFGNKVVLLHSKQTEAERHLIFEKLLNSTEPKVIIGPRSALFTPVHNLGLIIIDEAHENTYHQENAPKYSAIRVASFMAKTLGISCVLGSATPTITDYYMAQKCDSLIILNQKAKKEAITPNIEIIDLKKRENFSKNRYFCNELISATKQNLEAGRQTLIFHNRRGSAPLSLCEKCGEELLCPNCFLPLTLHADNYELVCHTCGFSEKVPTACPKCGAPELIHKGFGTKLLEQELKKLFPKARIRRFDADNKRGESLEAIYEEVKDGKVDILVGTQILAKGLDLPKLATVGVVQADAGLNLPDFGAEERVFQLLTQVIGRVGRGHLSEASVFIQTFRPEHPVLSFAVNEDYEGFIKYLLARRRRAGFPPFMFVAKCEITMKTETTAIKKMREAYKLLRDEPGILVSPPLPTFHEYTARGYTWQLIIRAKSRKTLVKACLKLGPNFRVTLDPPSLL